MAKPSSGFSLIEVALALMVVGLGFTTLLQMFPNALRMGQVARIESVQTLFANDMIAKLRAEAVNINTWADWNNDNWIKDVCGDFSTWKGSSVICAVDDPDLVNQGMGSYMVRLGREGKTIRVTLWCAQQDVTKIGGSEAAQKREALIRNGVSFYTELYFLGDQ